MLAWYLRDFDTVEVSNTFYQLPKEAVFDNDDSAYAVDNALTLKAILGEKKKRLKPRA